MLYAAFTFWLLVIVFSAWGVHALWSSLIRPKVVNGILLPGTLVAQLGYVLGLLVTGNSVQNLSLMGEDEAGEPQTQPPESHRLPVIGPIVLGLLPWLACTIGLYFATAYLGGGVFGGGERVVALQQILPQSLGGFWNLLRHMIDLMDVLVRIVWGAEWLQWRTVLFFYLATCLTVRMSPIDGNRRGALCAILLTGLTVGLLGAFIPAVQNWVLDLWGLLSFAAAAALVLLLGSLLVTGVVRLVRLIARESA